MLIITVIYTKYCMIIFALLRLVDTSFSALHWSNFYFTLIKSVVTFINCDYVTVLFINSKVIRISK